MADVPEDVQRWTARRRVALVLRSVRGETSGAAAARKQARTVAEIEEWQERVLAAAENALRARPKEEDARTDEQSKQRKPQVGERVLDLDMLREAATGRPPDPTTSGECSRRCRAAPSVGAGEGWPCRARRYGSDRRRAACRSWTRGGRRGGNG
jgi:hypothetical protein